ncbi:Transporter of the ATP-binding cassette (ABC) [Blastocladiella emersonii ATCC 22665]|nr:Transporter of the ATP-binding cassette (ABC) [Blastocladiella emersonii ATCC 22665]
MSSAAALLAFEYPRPRQPSLPSTGSVEKSSAATVASEESATAVTAAAPDAENAQMGHTVIEKDCSCDGVEWRVYRAWIDAAVGLPCRAFLIAFLFLKQLGLVGQDLCMQYWTNAYNMLAAGGPRVGVTWFIFVYVLIGALTLVAIGARLVVQFRGSIRFLDVTQLGRIINRLSRDMKAIDRELTRDLVDGLINGYQLASILVLIVIAVPAFLVFLVPIGLAYLSLSNLTRFLTELYKRIDVNHRAFFFLWVSNRWLTVRTDLLGAFIVLSTGFVLVLSRSWMDPALMGTILSYALNAVDCAIVDHWLHHIEQKPLGGLAAAQIPPSWPAHGAVEVRDLRAQYSATTGFLLHDINFKVPPRSRLACCGRTGASKVNLATAIFRLVQWASGEILIDGVNVGDVDLFD